MKHIELCKVGSNKGAPRVWIEGRRASIAGFLPGTRYRTKIDPANSLLTLTVADDGGRIVSAKTKGDKEIPIIDLNSFELLSMFSGLEAVRLVVADKRIHILPVASELRAKKRLERLQKKMQLKQPIAVASAATGIGILDLAVHEGMAMAGVETELVFANEIRADCMEHFCERNPTYGPNTVTATVPMQELVFDNWALSKLDECDVFVAGIPCSGASIAGRTKRGLVHPEDHPEVGHLVVSYIAMVAKFNPATAVLENVVPYASSASMSILRSSLRDLGYDVHEVELDAAGWNMLEPRKRLAMVAVTKGIKFSFDDLERPLPQQRTFGEIMDQVDPDHSTWGRIDYLWNKLEKDKAQGKGFAPTVVDASSTTIPTLTKNLAKRQSTGTFIQHPTNPALYRIPTVAEHARAKGIWEGLVEGTTQTFGHEALGQSISLPPFVSVFAALARALQAYGTGATTVEHPVFTRSESLIAA